MGGSVVTAYPDGLMLIAAGSQIDASVAIRELRTSSSVVYVQANSVIHDEATTVIPNDPGFPYSWGLNNANNVDIDAPEAWAFTTGSPSVIVAVLDSGLDFTQP